ncbi:hypothetical protein [Psychrobacter glacincola]|uniref:hypothetical protein n=1 Tax=Psychrobacter glacincola TaxID=56810 RepID=UPI003BB4FCE0
MITQNKEVQRIYSPIINEAQDIYMSINLLNLHNLSVPLQLLAKARYNLSVIHDELLHTMRDNLLNRSKIGQFTANLYTQLEHISLESLEDDPGIGGLTKPLTQMARKLYDSLHADESLTIIHFHNIAKQVLDIHECLDRVCLLLLYRKVEVD